MQIEQIRAIIRAAGWTRNDLTGGTREEFVRQNVGPILGDKIAQLEALDIPARFTSDVDHCREEIGYLRQVIVRWKDARSLTSGLREPHPDLLKAAFDYADSRRNTHITQPVDDFVVALADEVLRLRAVAN